MSYATPSHSKHEHAVPLWGLFLALLALTGLEVGLYELWRHSAMQGTPFMPKFAMVLVLIVVLTLPKAAIVLVYFMHLKFEKQFIIAAALIPFVFAFICVLPTLTDTLALHSRAYNQSGTVSDHYDHDGPGHGHGDSHGESHGNEAVPAPASNQDNSSY